MALLNCHECNNQISSEAKACPKCGAKLKKPTSSWIKILAALIAIGGISSFLGGQNIDYPKETAAPQLGWKYSTSKDQMSGAEITYATTRSQNSQDLKWPYGPGIGATLTLRKNSRKGVDAYINIDKGQILFKTANRLAPVFRFDDHPEVRFEGSEPDDMRSDYFMIIDDTKFVAELKKSKIVRVEFPIYQDGYRMWQFKVDGLTWN